MSVPDREAAELIRAHVGRVAHLMRDSHLAAWEAATTGNEEAIRRSAEARAVVKQIYADEVGFRRVRDLLGEGVADPQIGRELRILDHEYTANQLPPETIEDLAFREAELEGIFYNFRARLNGRELSNNELRETLRGQSDSDARRRTWEAAKEIGAEVAPRLLELVRRRNAAARDLGFADYYTMELSLQEFDEPSLFALLDDFRQQSDDAFHELRDRLDRKLAARSGISPEEVRPWHWDDFFAQEAPAVAELDLDPYYAGFDHEALVRDYFARIGLPVDDILERSDLYERDGKDQHAFCTDIDREGDIRILCNLRSDERWMRTLLHELGHAVYDKFLPRSLPYMLRTPAHILTTEAIAMFFGRLTREPEWMRDHLDPAPSPDREAHVVEQQRLSMLISARWMLVMAHFERALYADPDRSDLNALWWDLVQEFQLVRRPEARDAPDWATKIHLSLAPVYYHNYLLGELMASQLTHTLRAEEHEVGAFLRERVFHAGATLPWNELVSHATGEPLSARYFVEQFVAQPLAGGA